MILLYNCSFGWWLQDRYVVHRPRSMCFARKKDTPVYLAVVYPAILHQKLKKKLTREEQN